MMLHDMPATPQEAEDRLRRFRENPANVTYGEMLTLSFFAQSLDEAATARFFDLFTRRIPAGTPLTAVRGMPESMFPPFKECS